jgi:hypothetical protein
MVFAVSEVKTSSYMMEDHPDLNLSRYPGNHLLPVEGVSLG